jgi:hypothetical protein
MYIELVGDISGAVHSMYMALAFITMCSGAFALLLASAYAPLRED